VSTFQSGAIYWTAADGAHIVSGGIYGKYNGTGGPAGPFGPPTTDELAASDGTGRVQAFRAGAIYWSPQIGAASVFFTTTQNPTAPVAPLVIAGQPAIDTNPTPVDLTVLYPSAVSVLVTDSVPGVAMVGVVALEVESEGSGGGGTTTTNSPTNEDIAVQVVKTVLTTLATL
jgi:hypothetical protein